MQWCHKKHFHCKQAEAWFLPWVLIFRKWDLPLVGDNWEGVKIGKKRRCMSKKTGKDTGRESEAVGANRVGSGDIVNKNQGASP